MPKLPRGQSVLQEHVTEFIALRNALAIMPCLQHIAQSWHAHDVLLQRSFTRSDAAPNLACLRVALLVVFRALELRRGMIFKA